MSVIKVLVPGVCLQVIMVFSVHAQTLEPSQEVALDREGYGALWALDTPLEAPLRQRVGARFSLRLTNWLSSWGELRVSWAQKPSLARLGAGVWPIGDPLRGAYLSFGPTFSLAPAAAVGVDAFVETGVRYGWEGIAITLGARWDLKDRQAVPALTLMLGYTFAGTT